MYVQLDSLTDQGLTVGQVIESMACAVEELGVARGLVAVHGPVRGLLRYFEAGGRVRYGTDGRVWVPVWRPERRKRKALDLSKENL